MYINFWYPMATSEELQDKPLRVRALAQDFVVYRDSQGKAHCLSNTCTHRGGALAAGKIIGDNVQCPYHGWQFDGDGHCRRIPSLGIKASVPGRTRVDGYPVDERYGLIFAFLGDLPESERPPIMEVKEWGQDGWRATLQHFEIKGYYERSIENGIDPAHNEYVHDTHGFSGEREEEYKVGDMRMEESAWGRGFWHTFKAPPLQGDLKKYRPGEGDLEAGTGYHGTNHVWTFIHPAPNYLIHQYLFERPIDEEKTHLYLVCERNFALEEKSDAYVIERNQYVANQDVKIIENLHPTMTPDTNTKEFMVPSDKCILLYREAQKEWEQKGWRIDMDAVHASRGKVAYAIPSPGRRESKGWVLDPVPLVAASKGSQDSKPGLKAAG
ncbi:MAG: aromatic ring-hydroxylating dioxygenase subunit alpha [Gammaproteobacteria bacterium]|jgi:phenylpropionate dioxygenase-like ring-hydroxylating dioxygenase large terminal subunit|nr:aromatic ring-hydroxylating dioxygenase subunit alpha [Gammaproteobacteria bacterium]